GRVGAVAAVLPPVLSPRETQRTNSGTAEPDPAQPFAKDRPSPLMLTRMATGEGGTCNLHHPGAAHEAHLRVTHPMEPGITLQIGCGRSRSSWPKPVFHTEESDAGCSTLRRFLKGLHL